MCTRAYEANNAVLDHSASYFFSCMCMDIFAYMLCLCGMYVQCPQKKKMSDSLVLELQTVLSHHEMLGIEPGSSSRVLGALNY